MKEYKQKMKQLAVETAEVLADWKELGFTIHPVAQIIQHSDNSKQAIENLQEMISQCHHQIGWIRARRKHD